MSETRPPLAEAFARLEIGRRPHGIAAMLLPHTLSGEIHWGDFERLVARTRAAGLDVAVNMDTGFGDLLSPAQREQVLAATRRALGEGAAFHAGAYAGAEGDPLESYRASIGAIERAGAIPVIVQCRAMHAMGPKAKADFYRRILEGVERALAFELGPVFSPHGEIWDDETFERIMEIPQIIGAKHSSLDRATELGRLATRDRLRPGFRLYTGNDLAIDMVAYGSDYLLGLATFAPEIFARRDRALERGELAFLALNDALQHLGNVAFRPPVPAYKHSAAMYLHLTGALESDAIHPAAARRHDSERLMLEDCAERLRVVEQIESD